MTARKEADFLSFERVEIEASPNSKEHTTYACRIKALNRGTVLTLHVSIDLPRADRKLSELQKEIATHIHEATNPVVSQHSLSKAGSAINDVKAFATKRPANLKLFHRCFPQSKLLAGGHLFVFSIRPIAAAGPHLSRRARVRRRTP